MFAFELPDWLRQAFFATNKKKTKKCFPSIESLEERYTPTAIYRVTTLTDGAIAPSGGTGSEASPYTGATLRGALIDINANHAGDTNIQIRLTGGSTYKLQDGQLDVSLTATGRLAIQTVGSNSKAVIQRDSDAAFRIFEVSAASQAKFTNITITGGLVDDSSLAGSLGGGGILNNGALTLTNSQVSLNEVNSQQTTTYGGGILNHGSLTLSNTVVKSNTVRSSQIATGGGIANDGVLTINGGSTIASNLADGVLDNQSFFSVGGAAHGGGIGQFGTNAKLSLSNSVVNGNTAQSSKFDAFGGGISDEGDFFEPDARIGPNVVQTGPSITIVNSTISGNNALGGNGINFDGETGNGGKARGGGLSVGFNGGDSTVTILGSTIASNRAIGGNGDSGGDAAGGGIDFQYTHGSEQATQPPLRIVNSTISTNTVRGGQATGQGGSNGSGQGGGIYHFSTASALSQLVNVTVTQNRAQNGAGKGAAQGTGGGIFNLGNVEFATKIRIWNTIVAQNFVFGQDETRATSDVSGSFQSKNGLDFSGHNLIGNFVGSTGFSVGSGDIFGGGPQKPVSAGLNPLAYNGGPSFMQTHLPIGTSLAVNRGDDAAVQFIASLQGVPPANAKDQRGQPRKSGLHIDIGAVELSAPINRRWDR